MTRARFALFLAVGAAGLVIVLCFIFREKEATRRESWNLLWIVVDDLKADRLGSYGGPKELTPGLDRLARRGVRFRFCITQSSWSLPSYASMLTSRYPYELVLGKEYLKHLRGETEVARSRDPARMPETNHHWYVSMDEEVTTLAEALKAQGFLTAAWVNNPWLSPGRFNVEQGFDYYSDGTVNHPYTQADELVDLVLSWLSKRRGARWFAFVQFMDPHRPYQVHPGLTKGESFLELYDGEIAFVDRETARLMRGLDKLGLLEKTVVVLNADHGEGVFAKNRDFTGHGGSVQKEVVRVPLIMAWPGGPENLVVSALCRNLDIMPTVLELLGISGPPEMKGRSLVEEAKKSAKTSPEPAFTMAMLKGPEQVSLLVQGEKPEELFQLVAIPAYGDARLIPWFREEGPHSPARVELMMNRLRGFLKEAERTIEKRPDKSPPMLDDGARSRLKALGYFQ